MKRRTRTAVKTICYGLLSAALSMPLPAQQASKQQQEANAYIHWSFDGNPTDIFDVAQELWVATPAHGTQWVMLWKWTADPAHGGYLGFNMDDAGNGQMIFSIWNASTGLANVNAKCQEFGGEGTGFSCRMPFTVKKDRFYRLHVNRASTTIEGVWWRASIAEEETTSSKVHAIGALYVPGAMNAISGNSIGNFTEYFGAAKEHCSQVPVSVQFVAPPQANEDGPTGKYAYTARFSKITTPATGKCASGTEKQGASSMGGPFTLSQQSWPSLYPDDPPSNEGVIVFLGGKTGNHTIEENLRATSFTPPPRTIVFIRPPSQ